MPVRRTAAILLCAIAVACRGEQRAENVPPASEVERGPVELDQLTPPSEADVGQVVVATGEVVGIPLANGFFLRTGANEIVFIATDQQVHTGEQVRAEGVLARTDAASFRGWTVNALEGKQQGEWEVLDTFYIAATSITPL